QPLGQILVNQGVITRLELASALAEQWSEHASITPLPRPAAASSRPVPVPTPPRTQDEDEYAAGLQAAVAGLSEKVQATKAGDDIGSHIVELAERIEATVARSQRIEATMATMAESLEGVTSGVEEAFNVLRTGMSGLALDLARLDTTVSELVEARDAEREPTIDPALLARVEQLQIAVHGLSQRAA